MKVKKCNNKVGGTRDLISEAVRVSEVLAKANVSKPDKCVSKDVEEEAEKLMDSDSVRLGGFMASRFLTVR